MTKLEDLYPYTTAIREWNRLTMVVPVNDPEALEDHLREKHEFVQQHVSETEGKTEQ